MQSFRTNGKVLLSGEYLVMQGATAFAVPLKSGQVLDISEGKLSGRLEWTASDVSGIWFRGVFLLSDLAVVESSDNAVALRLQKILRAARSLTSGFLNGNSPVSIKTRLEFDRNWGFGSSSSLIALVSQIASIDARWLHHLVSEGSGYDVACALSSSPILFTMGNSLADVRQVDFLPPFIRQLYLVYLGKKQNSEAEVVEFKRRNHNFTAQAIQISEISLQMASVNKIGKFIDLMLQHESIMETVLGRISIMKLYFPDFSGAVKSLGAWGGDFVLAATERDEQYVRDYFKAKSLEVVFPFHELALLTDKQPVLPAF